MPNHVTDWLNAYFDGELTGRRLQQVEDHLAGCEVCQAELESLDRLSSLLHEIPDPEFTPVERFTAQVGLRLPHSQAAAPSKSILEIGWWMIPVGLLAAWVFIGTTSFVSGILSAANGLGVLSGLSDWLVFGPASEISVSATLGQSGLLSGNGLSWAETTETLTRTSLPQIILQVSIALLYLGWIAVWWARHARQGQGQLLEG